MEVEIDKKMTQMCLKLDSRISKVIYVPSSRQFVPFENALSDPYYSKLNCEDSKKEGKIKEWLFYRIDLMNLHYLP